MIKGPIAICAAAMLLAGVMATAGTVVAADHDDERTSELLERMRSANEEEMERLRAELASMQTERELLQRERDAILMGAGSNALDDMDFQRAGTARHVYRGRLENLGRENYAVDYLYKFAEAVNEVCPGQQMAGALLQFGADFFMQPLDQQARDDLVRQGLHGLMEMMQNPEQMLHRALERELALKQGTEDAIRFMRRYGCEGPVPTRLFANLNAALTGGEPEFVAPRTELDRQAIAPPEVEIGRIYTTIRYGNVPNDFVPEMPASEEYRLPYQIILEKEEVGALRSISVGRFHPFQSLAVYGADLRDDLLDDEDIRSIYSSGAVILRCNYVGARTGTIRVVSYWFQTRPPAAHPASLAEKDPAHLLLHIKGPREDCPAWNTEG